MATPEQIAAQVKEVQDLLAIAFPAPERQRNDPGSSIKSWLTKGATVSQIVDALTWALQTLNIPPDPGPGPSQGQWTGLRYKAFGGEFNIQDVLEPRVFGSKTKPSAEDLRARIFGSTQPSPGPTPTPTPVPVPPAPEPLTGGPSREEFTWLYKLVTENHDPRIVSLEQRVPVVSDPTKGGPGRP